MSSLTKDRRAARELALEILYQADIRGQLPTEVLSSRSEACGDGPSADGGVDRAARSDETVRYSDLLVHGVEANLVAIDEVIDRFSVHWALARMPVVDKNLLRLGTYEMLWQKDVPVAVVINEAVELAKTYSTDDSAPFIHGILGRVAAECA